MNVRYYLDHSSPICEHLEKDIVKPGEPYATRVDELSTRGARFEVIQPANRKADVYSTLYLHGVGTIEIFDPCEADTCVQLVIRTDKIETTILLPEGITLTSLDAAICSAIMEKRARDEGR